MMLCQAGWKNTGRREGQGTGRHAIRGGDQDNCDYTNLCEGRGTGQNRS